MKHHKDHQFSGNFVGKGHFVRGIEASTRINTDRAPVAASEIAAGMRVRLEDGSLSTVLSTHIYMSAARRVNVATDNCSMSLYSEAYIACSHALCELYFGSPDVAFPVKSIVGHDPAFTWSAPSQPTKCVALELEAIGWIQMNGLSVFIPVETADLDRGSSGRTPTRHCGIDVPSTDEKLLLSHEETPVVGSFNCVLADVATLPHASNPMRYAQ
ncbi:hypothetical protein [Celeribacter sp.]|uniref:hypothetical protein n=1 Tax=Celeribacter sp. TaxID=1890673 RepID=UPI003A8DB53D